LSSRYRLERSFAIARQWKVRPDAQWRNAVARQTPSHPVACVSWSDATDYAQWLAEKTGKKYRLPSASEWEYVARAGSTAERAWTNDSEACANGNVADRAAVQSYPGWTAFNCDDVNVQSAPVGSYAQNAFGLQDVLGNVFEWVADCWHENYSGAPTDGSTREGGDCSQHEMRGGSWFTAPALLRFAYRNRFETEYRSASVGFRIVREGTP
jgi:formylglycine-generating enzyme required for sulfatase activity